MLDLYKTQNIQQTFDGEIYGVTKLTGVDYGVTKLTGVDTTTIILHHFLLKSNGAFYHILFTVISYKLPNFMHASVK